MNNDTKVNQLLDKCKNLTEKHIIQACEKYHDELIKKEEGETHYIQYNDELYKLNPTIRYANNEFLNNDYKLFANRRGLTQEERQRVYTSYNYKEFFEQKFSQCSYFKLCVISSGKLPSWWEVYACILYKEKVMSVKELRESDIVKDICDLKYTTIDKLGIKTDLMEYSAYADKKYKATRRKDLVVFEKIEDTDKWKLNDFGIQYVKKNIIPKYKILLKYYSEEEQQTNKGNTTMPKPDKISKNLILYGPPGTGKTYNTVVEAIKILDEKLYEEYAEIKEEKTKEKNKKYEELEKKFNKFKEDGQLEFVTFHQSYSYEEFVEGIKPYIPKDIWEYNNDEFDDYANDLPDVKYIGKKGIFREICKRAEEPIIEKLDNNIKFNENPQIWKVSLKQTGDNDIRTDCMNNNRIRIGFDKYGETITDETVFDNSGSRVLPAFINKMEIGDIVLSCYSEKTIDAIGIITSEYKWDDTFPEFKRYREVEWLVKGLNHDITKINNGAKFTLGTVYRLNNMSVKDVLDIVNEQKPVTNYKENNKPYVLIIDEINRGNISKIFGELITLIEEDKRGKLKVRLPYSQDEFTVPENLYIIGTMNTSDRSIASVDIALRRRFTFKEMMPDPKLVADFGCKFDDIYKILNKKITILADRDHQIGHSYFIKDKHEGENIDDLKNIWFDSVLPLLNEYFYGDWEKLQEILGKAVDEKNEGKYASFIKELTPCINDDNCYDKDTDCFDFVKENEIDFEKALDNAFKKSLEKVFPDKYKTNNTTQGSVEENTEE